MNRKPRKAMGRGRGGKERSRWGVALVALLTLLACGDGSPPTGIDPTPDRDDPTAPKAAVNSFTAGLPSWSEFSPPVTASANAEIGDPVGAPEEIGLSDPRYNPDYVCTSTPYSMAQNPREVITMSGALGLLVPGKLMQGARHREGELRDLPISQRSPVTLTISLNNVVGDAFRVVDNPTEGELKTAVNELIQAAESSDFEAGSSVVFEKATSYSFEQAALGMGLSVRYMGSSVKGALESQTSAEKLTVTATFIQNAFTIGIETPNTASDWFSEDFTQARLDEQVNAGNMGPDNLPIYVSDVTYGRIIMITFTSSASEDDIKASLNATYNGGFWGGELDLDAEKKNVLRNAELSIQQLGGPTEGAFKLANVLLQDDGTAQAGDFGLAEFFAEDVSLTTFVPISYTLRNLQDNSIAGVGETSEYDVITCEPLTQTILSDFEANTDGWTPIDGTLSHQTSAAVVQVGNGAVRVAENTSGLTRLQAPDKFIGDKSGYLDGSIRYWVRWTTQDPTASNGNDLNPLTYPHMRIIGANGQILVYAGPFWRAADWPRNSWLLRDIPLTPGFENDVGWRTYTGPIADYTAPSTAVPATQADFEAVLADVIALEVQGEFRGGRSDMGYIDHFEMKPPSN